METDLIIKVCTLLIGVIGAGRLLYDLSIGKRSRMRDEYSFAKKFLDELVENPALHPFLREKGFQAIAGDRQISADEIEYLLTLQGPDRALRDYVIGRSYLEHVPEYGDLQIEFKGKYKKQWSRKWRFFLYLCCYFIFSVLAFCPLILSSIYGMSNVQIVTLLVVCVMVFVPYAWSSLKAAVRIFRAEKLVKHQHKHTQRIVVDSKLIQKNRWLKK